MQDKFHKSAKEEIELKKEQILKEIKESETLIKKTDVFILLFNEHVKYKKYIIDCKMDEQIRDERNLITLLNSNEVDKKNNAIEQLIWIAITSQDSQKKNFIKEVLTEQLKNNETVAKKILNGFFELYLYFNEINQIKWAASFHSSQEIKEYAQGILEIISKIEISCEKNKWKKKFKEKIKKYREREERYKKIKEDLKITFEKEMLFKFKEKLLERISSFISANCLIERVKIINELNQIINEETIKMISNNSDGKIENINIFNIYEISIKLAIIYLKEETLEKRKEEINYLLKEKLCRK